jgi:DNA mismatch endonuclease (patch repair protein)
MPTTSKNTKPELILRRVLWRRGLRYRIHNRKLPGTPDISIMKYRVAVFVDGSFWHGRDYKGEPFTKTNQDFWERKIQRNIDRDNRVEEDLLEMGYSVIRIWDTDVVKDPERAADEVEQAVRYKSRRGRREVRHGTHEAGGEIGA